MFPFSRAAAIASNVLGFGVMAVWFTACATTSPSTPAELARDSRTHPRRALVHYLGQPGASATVCSSGGAATIDARTLHAVARATSDGELAVEPANECLRRGLDSLDGPSTARLIPRLGALYISAVGDAGSTKALQHALSETTGPSRHPRPYLELRADLLEFLAHAHRKSPEARRIQTLCETLEVRADRWQGQVVDDVLIRSVEDEALKLFAHRLGSERLRKTAMAEIIRRAVAASKHPDVVRAPERAALALAQAGRVEVDLDATPISAMRFDTRRAPYSVVVRQDVQQQSAKLQFGDRDGVPIASPYALHGWLWFRVEGYSRELTLCEPGQTLDPVPCVPVSAVELAGPWASLDSYGNARLHPLSPIRRVAALLRSGATMPFEARVAGHSATARVPLRFIAPDPIEYAEERTGKDGPRLAVRLSTQPGQNLTFDIEAPEHERPRLVVVPLARAGAFTLISRGAPGQDGRNGRAGTSRWLAEHGEDASHGGRGGDIVLLVRCAPDEFDTIEQWLRVRVLSLGGVRGRGGEGGRAGPDPDATTCSTSTDADVSRNGHATIRTDTSCISWRDTDAGRAGRDGENGERGTITIERVPTSDEDHERHPAARDI